MVANVYQAPNGSIALIVANHGTEIAQYTANADLGSTSHSIAVTLLPTSARVVVLAESETTSVLTPSLKSDDSGTHSGTVLGSPHCGSLCRAGAGASTSAAGFFCVFVDPVAGSDANTGSTRAAAVLTIARGIMVVRTSPERKYITSCVI